MDWYHPGFAFKKALTIPCSHVSGGSDLLDFPLLVSITSADLKSAFYGGYVRSLVGNDFLFVDGQERRELAYELESYNGSTGSLLCWVRIPKVSAETDTVFYLYFSNPTMTASLANPSGVWDAFYSSVWHLGDGSLDPNGVGTPPLVTDSITYNAAAVNTAIVAPGIISGGATFTGSQSIQSLNTGGLDFTTGNTITLSAWAKRQQTGSWQTLVEHGSGTTRDYQLAFSGGSSNSGSTTGSGVDNLVFLYRDSGDTTWQCYASTFSVFNPFAVLTLGPTLVSQWLASPSYPPYLDTTNWHYYTFTYTYGVPSSAQLYVDGIPVSGSWTNGTGLVTPAAVYDNLAIGSTSDTGDPFNGSIDEVRISQGVARGGGWVATEYTNQVSPATFISVGETVSFEGNVDLSLIVSFGSVQEGFSRTFMNESHKGIQIVLNALSLSPGDSILLTLSGQDGSVDTLSTIGQWTATNPGPNVFTLYPEMVDSSTSTSGVLPTIWNVSASPATVNAAFYTVSASLIV